LRQKEGISYGTSSWVQIGALDRAGRFGLQAQYAPQNLPRLQRAVSEELARFVRDGITSEELAEAVSGILQQGIVSRSSDNALADTLANQLFLGRTMAFTAELEARLRSATPEAVNEAIRKYVSPAGLSQVYAGDFGKAPAQDATSAGGEAPAARP
jgi:zinc protease